MQFCDVLQEALPVLLDLEQQAQACHSGHHFTKEYMRQLLCELQTVLASNGTDKTVKEAEKLLEASSQNAGALTFQQLVAGTIASREVCVFVPLLGCNGLG